MAFGRNIESETTDGRYNLRAAGYQDPFAQSAGSFGYQDPSKAGIQRGGGMGFGGGAGAGSSGGSSFFTPSASSSVSGGETGQAVMDYLKGAMSGKAISDATVESTINKGTDEISTGSQAGKQAAMNRAAAMGFGTSGSIQAGLTALDTKEAGQKANLARDARLQADQYNADASMKAASALGAMGYGKVPAPSSGGGGGSGGGDSSGGGGGMGMGGAPASLPINASWGMAAPHMAPGGPGNLGGKVGGQWQNPANPNAPGPGGNVPAGWTPQANQGSAQPKK